MNHSPITKWYQPLLKWLSRTFHIKKIIGEKKEVLKYHKSSQKMGLFSSLIASYDLLVEESP